MLDLTQKKLRFILERCASTVFKNTHNGYLSSSLLFQLSGISRLISFRDFELAIDSSNAFVWSGEKGIQSSFDTLEEFLERNYLRRSKIEIQFCRVLRSIGLDIEETFPTKGYYLDAALRQGDTKLDIEVDGEYWHQNADGSQLQRDKQRDSVLISHGWEVYRIPTKSIDSTEKMLRVARNVKKKWDFMNA